VATRVLALDVDGVLFDLNGGGHGPWQRVLRERWGVEPDQLQDAFFRERWADIIIGRRALEPELEAAIEVLGWPMSTEELIQAWFEADFVLHHDVVAAAKGWAQHGVRLVLATNQEHRRAAFLAERLGRLLPVDGVAYSAALGRAKPDPEFFREAERQLGIADPTSITFLDDGAGNVDAARRCGWNAVHFQQNPGWKAEVEAALRL
jgi:putative hydrolase of the HAD superfamily